MDVTALVGQRTGVGEMVANLAARLARRDEIELTGVLVSWRGRKQLASVLPAGCEASALPLPARLTHLLWSRCNWPTVSGHDVVHGPNYVVPPGTNGARLVTVHDLTAWRFPDLVDAHSRRYPIHLRRALATGAHVHAVSAFVAEELRSDLGVPADRVHIVRNGFSPGPMGRAPVARTIIGGPYLLAVGTIEPRKDYVTLVRAMESVWRAHPDLRLVIAGAPGWGTEALDREVERLGVADKIRRMGYVTEAVKADLLAGAELLAYPSVYEGFGFPLLEAMAAGTPVVATNVGAVPETAGRAAVLVEPSDPSALAGALLAVLEDDTLRADLADRGRERSVAFPWERSVGELHGLYRELAGRSRPTGTLERAEPLARPVHHMDRR